MDIQNYSYYTNEQKIEVERNLALLKKDHKAFLSCPPAWQHDLNFVMEAVKISGKILKYVNDDFKDNPKIVSTAIKTNKNALKYASDNLKSDINFLKTINAQYSTDLLLYVHKFFGDNKSFSLRYIKKNGLLIQYVSESLKNDKDIVKAALLQNNEAFQYIDPIFLDDRELIVDIVKLNPKILINASPRLQNDSEIVLLAIEKSWEVLKYASSTLKEDINFMSQAILINSNCIGFASTEIRNNEEIYKDAIEKNGLVLQYLSNELKDNKDLALIAMHQNYKVYKYLSLRLKEDDDMIDLILSRGKVSSGCYHLLPDSIKSQKKYALKSVSYTGQSLCSMSLEFTNDKDIVLAAIENDIRSIKLIGQDLIKEIGNQDPLKYLQALKLYNQFQENVPNKSTTNNIKKIKI